MFWNSRKTMFKLYFYLLRLEKETCLKTLWPSQDHWEWHTSWSLPRRPTPLTWWDELIFFFSWCKHPVILRDCCTEIYLFLSKLLTCSSWFFFVLPETCSTSQRSHTSFQSAQGKPCKLKRLFWTMAQMMTVKILTVWWCFQSKRTDVPELQTCHQNFFLIFFF